MRMLDESSLARLAEMGIDVYVPLAQERAAARPAPVEMAGIPAPPVPQASVAVDPVHSAPRSPISASSVAVVLIAQSETPKQDAMLDDVERALRFARVECRRSADADESVLLEAGALVLFGERQVRSIGARLPARRQREIGWIATGEPGVLAGDAQARRALWSELRRVVRLLGSAR